MHGIATTLVTGPSAAAREAAIAAELDPAQVTAVIAEGLPDGSSTLAPGTGLPLLTVTRIAPGCICCSGNLTMRVTLNRALRQQPARLFISLADATHLDRILLFLRQEPYDKLLSLTKDLDVSCRSST